MQSMVKIRMAVVQFGAQEWTDSLEIYAHKHGSLSPLIMKKWWEAASFYDFIVEKRGVSS